MDLNEEILKEIEQAKESLKKLLENKKLVEKENVLLSLKIKALEDEVGRLRKDNKSVKEKEKFATFAQHLSKTGVKKESLIKNLDQLIEKMDVYLNQIASKTGE